MLKATDTHSALFAPDAERAVLGAILGTNEHMAEAISFLRPEDFSAERERIIYAHCWDLWDSSQPIDEMTLAHSMTAPGELQKVGGVAYLSELADLPKRSSITRYIDLILDRAKRRKVLSICELGESTARDLAETDYLGELRDRLLELDAAYEKPTIQHVRQFSDAALLELEAERNRERDLPGLTFTIRELDVATTGIRDGQLVILGGRSGEGKSAFAMQIALKNAIDGVPVGIFSLELTREQILHRMWAQYSHFWLASNGLRIHEPVAFQKIRDPKVLTDAEWTVLTKFKTEVDDLPIYIDATSSLSIRQLVARAQLMVRRHRVGLIVVDYLQIVDAPGDNERERLTKISNALRALAKEGVPVLALSQLSRPKDPNARPNKYSLKESGSLEADAHLVLLIYRPTDEEGGSQSADGEILIAKQRSGPVGSEPVKFESTMLVFTER
jgi:replicative DNA helicase